MRVAVALRRLDPCQDLKKGSAPGTCIALDEPGRSIEACQCGLGAAPKFLSRCLDGVTADSLTAGNFRFT